VPLHGNVRRVHDLPDQPDLFASGDMSGSCQLLRHLDLRSGDLRDGYAYLRGHQHLPGSADLRSCGNVLGYAFMRWIGDLSGDQYLSGGHMRRYGHVRWVLHLRSGGLRAVCLPVPR
jgi:hypothetical protein